MNKKNSLTQFKRPVTPILPGGPAPVAAPLTNGDDIAPLTPVMGGRTGPKPKPPEEKRSHRVMLSMTPGDAAISRQRAGLAGEATVIMAFLRENGYFS